MPSWEVFVFGSNQNSAVVVESAPKVRMSLVFRGEISNVPETLEVVVENGLVPEPPAGQEVLQSVEIQIVVAEIAVEEAYGKVEAVELVAVKYRATTCPTTESLAYGEEVPRPRFPLPSRVNIWFVPPESRICVQIVEVPQIPKKS